MEVREFGEVGYFLFPKQIIASAGAQVCLSGQHSNGLQVTVALGSADFVFWRQLGNSSCLCFLPVLVQHPVCLLAGKAFHCCYKRTCNLSHPCKPASPWISFSHLSVPSRWPPQGLCTRPFLQKRQAKAIQAVLTLLTSGCVQRAAWTLSRLCPLVDTWHSRV